MNKLLNVNREGGYPLVGENLKIISEDYHNYLNSILNGLRLPNRSCVFLQLKKNFANQLGNSIAFVVGSLGIGEIYNVNANDDINVNELLSGEISCRITNNSQSYSIENELGLFTNAYNINSVDAVGGATLLTRYKFMMLDDAIRMRMETPTKQLDLAQCKFWVGGEIGFDNEGIITGVTPLDTSLYTSFGGSDNSIERIGNFLKLNFTFQGSPAGGSSGLETFKNIIELPVDFVNFSKITRLKIALVSFDDINNVNMAIADTWTKAVIYKNYIIMTATTGIRHNVVDYIPIV